MQLQAHWKKGNKLNISTPACISQEILFSPVSHKGTIFVEIFMLFLMSITSCNSISSLVFLIICMCGHVLFYSLQHLVSAYVFSLIFMSFNSSWCCILAFYYNPSILFTLGWIVFWSAFGVLSPRNLQLSSLCLYSSL